MTYKLSTGSKNRLLLSCAVLAIATTAPAIAQDSDIEEFEEVVVTGSRIRQNPLDAQNPVQVLSAEDMRQSGQISIGDFLQRLPISGSAINRANNASGNLGFPPDGSGIGAGASQVDLRNLGATRTLVLVDGKRWVRGSSASGVSGAVDLNTIPTGIIKSIEILQDGASTVYGSDAIAGVVNIITRDDYDGIRATAYYGQYDEGDGKSQEYDLSWGVNSDRARILVDLSYTKQGAVEAKDRPISAFAIPVQQFGGSSGTPQGRFVFNNGFGSITPDNGTGPIPNFDPNDPTGPNSDYHAFTLADRFNYSPFNKLLTPSERINIFVKSEYDVTDTITLNVKASYNNRRSVSQAAPEPLFFGIDAGAGFWMDNIVIPVNQQYNPFGIELNPSTFSFGGRRPVEQGPRVFTQNVDTYVISGTLDGEVNFGDRKWFWDVSSTWAKSQALQVKDGAFNARKINTALGDPAFCAADPACVPLNIFGGEGTLTPAMLDYITFTQKDQSRNELFDVSANFSGELIELPAGPLGLAVGWEYRSEKGNFIPDNIVSAGETAGIPASPTVGQIDVKEFYGEINVPLVADVAFAKYWNLTAAVRNSNYSTSGSNTVYKVGSAWQVNDDLTFRANWSEGFRAPHIGELFNNGSRFDSTITDPCDSVANPTVPANCAALGVPATHSQPNAQISVTTGGNRNLTPETAKTWTAGLTYNPADMADAMGLDGITFEINYYSIKMRDVIQAPNAAEVLQNCVSTLSPLFCDNVDRSSSGVVRRIDGILTNIASINTSGMDWSISFETHAEDWGQFRFRWNNNHLFSYEEGSLDANNEVVFIERAGTELGSPEKAYVKFKSSVFIDWTRDEWMVALSARYIGSFKETSCGGLTGAFFPETCTTPDSNDIPSVVYTDLAVTYSPDLFDGESSFTFGIQNILDQDTPYCFSCDLNNFEGTVHQIPGRFFYGRFTYKM